MRARRATPRRRSAPIWTADEWQAATLTLMRRSRERCEVCGKPLRGKAERHHRQRRRDGGDRLANLLLIHPGCHTYVTEHPTWARARGYIVSAYTDDPAAVPVLLWGGQWVTLDDLGRASPAAPDHAETSTL